MISHMVRRLHLAPWLVLLLLAIGSSNSHADCLDDFVAKNGKTQSIDRVMQDPTFIKCRSDPNPGARKAKFEKSARIIQPAEPRMAVVGIAERPIPPPTPPAYITNFYPMLRSSFTDVWLFDKRKGVSNIADAEGAQFSFADDRVSQNRTWTAHAMGAVVFQYLHDRYPKDGSLNFIGLSVAPYF